MNKLAKEKKNKLVLVILGTLIVTAAWGFGLLAWQRDHHQKALRNLEQREAQLKSMTEMMARSKNVEAELAEAGSALAKLEAEMASGDIYAWAVNALREFRQGYKLDIPQVAQPVLSENQLLPKFPYQQASISVVGTGTFHDFGVFIADFENRFPHARITNLELKPAGQLGEGSRTDPVGERLTFTMDIIFLVKPTAS